MLVGYARVSTDLQSTDGQIDNLKTAGCERVFEESMSGTCADRPQLAEALAFMRSGDVLVVVRLDRLGHMSRDDGGLLSVLSVVSAWIRACRGRQAASNSNCYTVANGIP